MGARDDARNFWLTNIYENVGQYISGQDMQDGGILHIIDQVQYLDEIVASPQTIVETSGAAITVQASWLQTVVRWNHTANGVLTLPETATLALEQGFVFRFYNNTDSYSVSIVLEGTDTLKSHNNVFDIPAESYAIIGKLESGTPNEWYASIEQTFYRGYGYLYNGSAGTSVTTLANTWHEIPIANPTAVGLKNFTQDTYRLVLDTPNNGTNGMIVTVNAHASIEIANPNETIDFVWGLNGSVGGASSVVFQSAKSGGNQTAGQFWPYSHAFTGIVANGGSISLFLRTTQTGSVNINNINFTVSSQAWIGVDIPAI